MLSESVSQGWSCRYWLAISSLDAPLERSTSLRSMIIMKEFLILIYFILLSSNLKLSIYIFVMSVRHVFAEFRFIFVKRSCSRRDGRKHPACFVYFITMFCWYCECTQIKVDPLQLRMMYYSYLYKQKMMAYFKLFPLTKMQVIALAPPCPAKRALASTLRTNYWIQLTFI